MHAASLEGLVDLIHRGKAGTWSTLPAERELAARFSTSRHEVRRALDELEMDGYIVRKRGRAGGTMVRPRRLRRDFNSVQSLPRALSSQGFKVGCIVHEVTVHRPSDRAKRALALPRVEPVTEIVRSRVVEGALFSLERAMFPVSRAPELVSADVSGSLYEILERDHGVRIARAEEEIAAVACKHEQADVLGIEVGAPLLSVTRVGYDDQDVAVEFSRDLFVGSQILGTLSMSGCLISL